MLAMSRLQPEMKKLQAKYKDDRQKLNEEMMAFYQENKINPFSSCLPLLLQMPIFIVLYRVIAGLATVDPKNGDGPKYLKHSTQLYQDLKADIVVDEAGKKTIEMMAFGVDLAKSLTRALSSDGFVTAIPYMLMVALVAITGFVQQKQISGRNPTAATSSQQQMIMRIMPAFFALISISIPAGVVVYFVVSNVVRIGQQYLVTHLERDNLPPAVTPAKSKVVDKGGGTDKRSLFGGKSENGKKSESGKTGTNGKKKSTPPPRRPDNAGKASPPPTGGPVAPRPRKRKRR
jgi:YidC/Oxa1 family membrane protein insertase